jgi:hypothetical protein
MSPEKQYRLERVESLISELDDRMDTPEGLMREHLTALRGCILGSMPDEYHSTVKLAKEILPDIGPPELRSRVGDFLDTVFA